VKILIVTCYFPPQNTIGGLRPYSWAKWWSREGHDITVLTTAQKQKNNDLIMDISNFNVIKLPVPLLSTISSLSPKKNPSGSGRGKYFSIWSFLKKVFFSFASKSGCFYGCRYPDFLDLWAKKAIKQIKHLYFDIVISTGGPYSVHRIGLALKKKRLSIKWIIDWRDLWTKNHLFLGLSIFHMYERYLENKFHQNANLIITVSEPLADVLRHMTETRVETIYNGFDPEDYQQIKLNPRKDNDIFTIVYTGSIYKGFQDASSLFEAISRLKQKGLISSDNLSVQFAGGVNTDVSGMAEKYNISDCYKYLGFLPREDALQMQYDADAVLFLEYNNSEISGILTGKLFEYLYIAREIIAVGIDGYTTVGTLIKDTQAGYCFGTNVRKIEDYLEEKILLKNKKRHRDKNIERISIYSRDKQAAYLLDYISNV
jgi:glycosyltransferase involved in cell wall biosynthesis